MFLIYSPRLGIGRSGFLNCPCLVGSGSPYLEELSDSYSILLKMVLAESNPTPLYSARHIVGAQVMLAKSDYLATYLC